MEVLLITECEELAERKCVSSYREPLLSPREQTDHTVN